MVMVERYGFDDDGITWGPNTGGAFVSVHDYDALAARLATCERERDAAIRGHDAAHAACVDYEARLAEAERLLRATVDGYPIGATNDGGVFVNGGLTGEILVYFALYDEPMRASDSANEVQK